MDIPKKICIVRLSALGDVTLMVPLIRTLQKAFPQSQITWIIGKNFYPLLEGLTGVEFIPINKPRSLGDYLDIKKLLQGRSFDVLLATQASFRANLMYPFISAKTKIGFDPGRSKDLHRLFIQKHIQPEQEHLLEGFLGFAKALGVHEYEMKWELPISPADRSWAYQYKKPGKKILAVNAMASKIERAWFKEDFVKVIRYAQENWGAGIVFTGGPGQEEKDFSTAIAKDCHPGTVNLVGRTTLKQLAATLEMADVLLAPDTGPGHIATAMGTPVVGLYAVAPAKLSGPYFSRDLVIDKYAEAVEKILHKNPGTIPWGTRVHTQEAMKLIKPAEVIDKLKIIFE